MSYPRRRRAQVWIVKLAALIAVSMIAVQANAHSLWVSLPAGAPLRAQTLPDFMSLAARLGPTVVNVSTRSKQPVEGQDAEPQGPMEQFGPLLPRDVDSIGSGVIINRHGYILTNEHVIEGAARITVTLSNGRAFRAKVVGRDAKTDVALLKIDDGGNLPAAPLGNSDRLRVGQWVMAIGNPFGFDHSVTAGIISAKGRFIPGSYDDYIQTDASINPGNSGGPLINLRGEVVGITSAIYTRTGSSMGIGFAIPINLVKEELDQLYTRGRVVRGWLGVYVQEVTPPLAQSLGLEVPHGALVSDVLKNGPASAAGIERGDVIVEYDRRPIKDSHELPLLVGATPLGRTAEVTVIRNSEIKRFRVRIAASHEPALQKAMATGGRAPGSGHSGALGIQVRNLTPKLAKKLGLSARKGVVVTAVAGGSVADLAGLHRRDIILEVNRRPVDDLPSYQQALEAAGAGSLLLLIRRADSTQFVAVKRPG